MAASWNKFFVLLLLASTALAAEEVEIVSINNFDLNKYGAGSHFSIIFDELNPSVAWVAPSIGATYANGDPVMGTVERRMGHKDIVKFLVKTLNPKHFNKMIISGAGFTLMGDGSVEMSYKSRSQNSSFLNPDGILPKDSQKKIRIHILKQLNRSEYDPRNDCMQMLKQWSGSSLQ